METMKVFKINAAHIVAPDMETAIAFWRGIVKHRIDSACELGNAYIAAPEISPKVTNQSGHTVWPPQQMFVNEDLCPKCGKLHSYFINAVMGMSHSILERTFCQCKQ